MKPSTQEQILANFRKNLKSLKAEFDDCLELSLQISEDFGGPSVYFHQLAIQEAREGKFLGKEHLKMIYAVLPAWGMHRMGKTTAKIVSFGEFKEKIVDGLGNELRRYKKAGTAFDSENADKITELILSLDISVSEARLVSASKVLHHILPDLVPPIDRAYSIRFMKQGKGNFDKKTIFINKKDEEWFAKTFLGEIQVFINDDNKKYKRKIEDFLKKKHSEDKAAFNTSLTKILDNLIIAFVKKYTV